MIFFAFFLRLRRFGKSLAKRKSFLSAHIFFHPFNLFIFVHLIFIRFQPYQSAIGMQMNVFIYFYLVSLLADMRMGRISN